MLRLGPQKALSGTRQIIAVELSDTKPQLAAMLGATHTVAIAAHAIDIAPTPVEELMTTNPECLGLDDEIVYALNQMSVGGYQHIPLVDSENRPTGVVSMCDLVGVLVEVFPQDVLNIPPFPKHGLQSSREGA